MATTINSVKQDIITLSWNDIHEIVNTMFINSKKHEEAEIILAIQRGGLIPGVMLSHLLNIREFITLDVRVTKDDSVNSVKDEPILIHNEYIDKIRNKRVILVDDIIGSGATHKAVLNYIMQYCPLSIQSYICVINKLNWCKYNDNAILSNAYIGKEVSGWVKFPWENKS